MAEDSDMGGLLNYWVKPAYDEASFLPRMLWGIISIQKWFYICVELLNCRILYFFLYFRWREF